MGLRPRTKAFKAFFGELSVTVSVPRCYHDKCSIERKTGYTMVLFINGIIAVGFTCGCRRAGESVCV